MSEKEVLDRLGPPYRQYDAKTVPSNYYIEGYLFERRQVTGKVLIYKRAEPILYVYIGPNGLVEHTFVGGS